MSQESNVMAKARRLAEEGKVAPIEGATTWLVEGDNGTYMVTLVGEGSSCMWLDEGRPLEPGNRNPRGYELCPARVTCSHVRAAQYRQGMDKASAVADPFEGLT
jgi:hypothetical protein